MARHGGGAFSGKDPTKVDRSAAYAVRHVAKNVVAAGIATRCEVQVAYAIGVAHPVSVMVETFGTSEIDPREAARPGAGALRPAPRRDHRAPRPAPADLPQTAAYGHFGRTDRDFTWERTDHADALARPPNPSPKRPRDRATRVCPGPARRPGDPPRVRLPRSRRARRRHVRVGTIVRVPLHGRRVRGWVLDADVRRARGRRSTLREVLAVVSAGPPPDVRRPVPLGGVALGRPAGRRFLRAASPPNVVRADDRARARDRGVPAGSLATRTPTAADRCSRRRRGAIVARAGRARGLDARDRSRRRRAPRARRDAASDEGREVLSLRSDRSATPSAPRAWDRARAGACVVVGGRTAVWAPVPDLARGRRARRGRRGARGGARAHVERPRRRARTRRARAGATRPRAHARADGRRCCVGASTRPRRRSPRVPWPRVEVVDQRDEQPGHGLLTRRARRRAAPRASTRGARAVCVLNRTGRARLLACRTCRELARCERCGATVEQHDAGLACPRCAPTRPPVCLALPRHARSAPSGPGITRVRDDLAALLPRADGRRGRRRDRRRCPTCRVLVGTEAVLHRVPRRRPARSGWSRSSSSTRSCSRRGPAPPSRRSGCSSGRPGCSGRAPTAGGCCSRPGCPTTRWCVAARRGDPLRRRRRRDAPGAARSGFPPFGGVAELSGDADAVGAACDALRGVDGASPCSARSPTGTRALVPRRDRRRRSATRSPRPRSTPPARARPPAGRRRSPPGLTTPVASG